MNKYKSKETNDSKHDLKKSEPVVSKKKKQNKKSLST